MASIVAKLVATKRNLRQNRKNWLPPNKSNYTLDPFDTSSSEEKGNRLLLNKFFRRPSEFERKHFLPPSKSNYKLTSFSFSDEKHNKYLRNRSKSKRQEEIQGIAKGSLNS